jgi:energy-coupling factor transporter ATP-binding protein EcfA2
VTITPQGRPENRVNSGQKVVPLTPQELLEPWSPPPQELLEPWSQVTGPEVTGLVLALVLQVQHLNHSSLDKKLDFFSVDNKRMEYNIKYFDPNRIKKGAVVLILGRRGSGKSTVAEDLLSYRRDCTRGLCISATERSNHFWRKHIPRCFIHYDFNDSLTKHLFNTQNEIRKQTGLMSPVFAIYDDLLFDKRFSKSKQTRRLFMNGRHSNIFTLVTAQYLMDVSPDLRQNIDYVFVLRDNIRANREKIYNYFAGVFPTFQAFEDVMMSCTQNHECMVLDQTSLSYDVTDSVFFYKATPDLQYRICSDEFWDFSAQKQENVSDEEEETDNKVKRGSTLIRKMYPRRS